MGIKQSITQLQNDVRQNTVIGGGSQLATKTSGGIVMGSKVSLDTFENKNLPTLWSLKTAPGQQFVHRDKSGREYPAIYIYTGVNPNVTLESVHLKNPWIADGVHPGYFSFGYFDTLRDDDPATYSRQSGQYFNATWQTAESIHNCVTRVASKRLDGWVELPIAAKSVRAMYAVAYLGFGLVPTLGFFAVPYELDETDVTLPAGLSGVGALSWKPDFSRFHDAAAIDRDCFHGIIGAPKLIYGQTPYTDSMEPFIDAAASGYIASGDGLQWQMYSAGAAMEFTDPTDTNEYTFRPVMVGGNNSQVIGDGDLWRYAFALEFQPSRWKMPDTFPDKSAYQASAGDVQKSSFVSVASADEGTLYRCNFIHADGYTNTLNLIDLKADVASGLGYPDTMRISWSDTSATPITNKGEEIALLVSPDYGSEWASGWSNDKSLNLFLAPIYLDNTETNYDVGANGTLAYYPIVWAGRYNAGVAGGGSLAIPPVSYINACEILGQSDPGSYTNDGHGPWTVQRGENAWRYVGQLCPKYVNTSLEKLYSTVPGDSFIDIQPDQYAPSAASGSMGRYAHQNGSIDVNTYVRGNDAKTAYSLYQFSTASATNIRDYFAASGEEGPEPLGPDDDWLASGVSARCPVNLVARVGNLASAGEVPYLGGTDSGYHLEYIDINTLFRGTYWRTGGTYSTNWAPSIAIGNASGDAVIITVE